MKSFNWSNKAKLWLIIPLLGLGMVVSFGLMLGAAATLIAVSAPSPAPTTPMAPTPPPTPSPAPIEWEVVRVVDGDTVDFKHDDRNVTVRLAGMDAPEVGHCGAKEATTHLADFSR